MDGSDAPSFISVMRAIGARRLDTECLVVGQHRLTWSKLLDRATRLSNVLHDAGLGCRAERSEVAAHESGQDHLAIYLRNGAEYLESMLGAFGARVAPFNVNYRYVADELRHLLTDGRPRACVVHARFAPVLAEVRADVPWLETILQVPDDSDNDLLDGAVWFDDALAAASSDPPPVTPSPDDLYLLYTGGTTGAPKAVMWRNGDAMVECFGGSAAARTVDDFVADADGERRALIPAPFMHGAGHWVAFRTWLDGGVVYVPPPGDRLDAAEIWSMVEREALSLVLVIGDAFVRPMIDELDRGDYDLSSLTVLLSGGAPLSAHLKHELLTRLPAVMIVDGLGSSEAGGQVSHVSTAGGVRGGIFVLAGSNHVLSADRSRVLAADEHEIGWLAKSGRLALGYLGDADRTAETYPTVEGVRYVVPGDRARRVGDRDIELLGRDSVTINSGGEKVFAEEVESAIKSHWAVYDCLVAGRPSARWGDEVVAIVQLRNGHDVSDDDLLEHAATRLARYKLPKSIVRVDEVVRSPAGKADYRWAASVAANASTGT